MQHLTIFSRHAALSLVALALTVLATASGGLAGIAPISAANPAQTPTSWTAEYYNNPYLTGSPVLTRTESSLEQDWGVGSPDPSVQVDNWSARFATDVYFQAGSYRFFILADDGVKLWIDYPPDKQPTIDTYNRPRPGQMLTADVTLSAGSHHIQVDYHDVTGNAYLYVTWQNLANGVTTPDFPAPVTFNVLWTAQYYSNNYLGGNPVLSQSEPGPSHNWGTGSPGPAVPADNFSARWTVYQQFDGDTYTISVRADDGVRVLVDGALEIDQWHGYLDQTYSATFVLPAGQHSIVIEYYEATGNAFIDFGMTRSGAITPNNTGATATVNAYVLNVRDAPLTGNVITKIQRNEQYPVVGRNSDSSWWQINVNGTLGWVSGRYVTVNGGQNVNVTTTNYAAQQTPYPSYLYGQCPGFLPSRLSPGGYGRVTPGLSNNLRAQPSVTSALIGQIPPGGVFSVLGGPVCAESTAWYQVNYYGVIGWTMEGQSSTYWLEPYSP